MVLAILEHFILERITKDGEHTINSLSKTLRLYRPLIYRPHTTPQTMKDLIKPIPKIDISKCLLKLEKLGYVKKEQKTLIVKYGAQAWLQKANVYKITEEGKRALETTPTSKKESTKPSK